MASPNRRSAWGQRPALASSIPALCSDAGLRRPWLMPMAPSQWLRSRAPGLIKAPLRSACRRSVPSSHAPRRSLPLSDAPFRLLKRRSALRRSAPSKRALLRLARHRSAALRFASLRSACTRSASASVQFGHDPASRSTIKLSARVESGAPSPTVAVANSGAGMGRGSRW